MMLDAALQERIHQLWDELAAFEAGDADAALMHLLASVADMVDAQNAYWMGAVRLAEDDGDRLLGWRPRIIRYLRPLPFDESYTKERLKSLKRGEVDDATAAHAREAGTFRARRLCDLVSPDWFESETYKGYLSQGVYDSLSVVAPASASAEGYYGFLRMRPNDPFTEAERDFAFAVLRPLMRFHRQVLLAHGLLVAKAPLAPKERQVLALLLTDRSEKEIAAQLDISPSTVHSYVRGVLRKFGVSGRSGLVSVWLGRKTE